MDCVAAAGRRYGLSFNWSKIEALPVRTEAAIPKPGGGTVVTKQNMIYLGSMIAADGRMASELGRRIGQAKADFDTLRKVWAHSTLLASQKLRIYDACVVSKLVYGLHTATLNKAERNRLDGFHARCLRRILKIPPAYHSRVSNLTVLGRAHAHSLSSRLLRQQLLYLGQVARRDDNDPVRCSIFRPGTFESVPIGARRQGRPRHTWAGSVLKTAAAIAGSVENLRALLAGTAQADRAWRAAVHQYCTTI